MTHLSKLQPINALVSAFLLSCCLCASTAIGGDTKPTERVTIQEFYKRARQADHIMPEARIWLWTQTDIEIIEAGIGFDGKWTEYYFSSNYGPSIQKIFRRSMKYNFDTFHNFMITHRDQNKIGNVTLYDEGYMLIPIPSIKSTIILRIEPNIVNKIRTL